MAAIITGFVRDIQPRQPTPTLELHFDRADATHLPAEHRAAIELEADHRTWRGTIGIQPGNPPYLHTRLTAGNETTRVSDLLLHWDLAPGARLRFEVPAPGRLRLVEIEDRGAWPPGRSPEERKERGGAPDGIHSRVQGDTFSDRDRTRAGAKPEPLFRSPSPIGRVVGVDGRYRTVEVLGRGGMGIVYLAEDLRLHRKVALKRLLPVDAAGDVALERFRNEAHAIAQLQSPNIVTVHDYAVDAEGPYLVMEYVRGETLHERLRRGPIDPDQCVAILRGLCHGMAHAHRQGVLHRDLKPANVILDEAGAPRILDFGLARSLQSLDLSRSGQGLGTFDYAAPEQKRDAKKVDHRADIYSLGAIFYELLTNLAPPPHVPRVPEPWQPLVARACDPVPEDRYDSVEELLQALEDARTGHLTITSSTSTRSTEPTLSIANQPNRHLLELDQILQEAADLHAKMESKGGGLLGCAFLSIPALVFLFLFRIASIASAIIVTLLTILAIAYFGAQLVIDTRRNRIRNTYAHRLAPLLERTGMTHHQFEDHLRERGWHSLLPVFRR